MAASTGLISPKHAVETTDKTNEDPNHVGIIFPNGFQLSAGGQLAIMACTLLCSMLFICEKCTKITMCIIARLNHQPEPPR